MQIALTFDSSSELPAVPEHQPVEFVCPAQPGVRYALSVDGRRLEPFLRPADGAWRWSWNPGAAVGLHEVRLEVQDGGAGLQLAWRLRAVPRKIDQERYALLLDDVERLAAGLAFTLASPASESAAPATDAARRPSPAEEYYALFAERLDSFERAVRRIYARPREQLRRVVGDEPLGGPAAPDAAALAHAARGDLQPAPAGAAPELQRAISAAGGLLPTSLPAARGVPTADFYEHRLLKRLLTVLIGRARRIGGAAASLAARLERSEYAQARLERARRIAEGCDAAIRRLRELRAAPLLAEVEELGAFRGPTPLLQRDPAYREVYRTWLALHRAPFITLTSPLFDIPVADLPHLYEAWCALIVASAMLALGSLQEQRLVTSSSPADSPADDLDLTVALAEDLPLLRVARGDTTLTLRYQPRYRPLARERSASGPRSPLGSLDRHTRVPDLAIEVERPGTPLRVFVLDAKYRLEADGGVPQDALAEAYAYLGAIGAAGERRTLGAALLYPGRGAPERYPSGVGAIPLLPGETDHLAAELCAWLDAAT